MERQKAKSPFEKTIYKNANNFVFGKCIENVKNNCDMKLSTKWNGRYGCKVLVAKPNFKRRVIFSENFVCVELSRTNIYYNKCIIVGAAILEISKIRMYEFLYDFLKPKFNDDLTVTYYDTDSFIILLQNHDLYQLIKENLNEFDTSDYDPNNPYGMPLANAKKLGFLKDEGAGKPIQAFVGIKSKMYAIKFANGGKVIKKAKGVKKSVVNKKISFENYMECLQNHSIFVENQNLIRSHLHTVYSIQQTKKVLDSSDDKRFLLEDGIHSYAFGHFKIPKE